ncbi:MAG: hypothetical protein ACR2H1_01555, partial [Limisphaerales bacterium]
VELTTGDHKKLSSRILGLSYFDSTTGQSVLFAELKDAQGFILPPNQVIYPDAFTDFKADVRYTYTKAGFEQDVILREQPPSPAEYGFNPDTTRLQLFTEFNEPPIPTKQQETKGNLQSDRVLDFGAMQIGVGIAFFTGDNAAPHRKSKVDKNWTRLDGRDFLIEELNYKVIDEDLQALPLRAQAANKPVVNGVRHLVSRKRLLPERKVASKKETKPIKVASLEQPAKGFVLDYSIVTSQTDFTFKGDTTYYITNNVNLTGTTIIEGGTVLKFNTNTTAKITIGTNECKTDAYRPAIFTSMHDNSVGEMVAGSTGNPLTNYCGEVALYLNSSASQTNQLSNVRFSYLNGAISDNGGSAIYLDNVQCVRCKYPFTFAGSSIGVRNGLFYDIDMAFDGGGNVS